MQRSLKVTGRDLAVSFALLVLIAQGPVSGQLLGKISFPNSGASQAQGDFIEGVLYLHNFEYEDAARAFRRAQELDPDFALAYWGETMTHNHSLWGKQNPAAAIEILERLAETPKQRAAKAGTDRERGYLEAVERLFGTSEASEGLTKQERDFTYSDAMRRLAETYPEDHEAASFYALSILGTAHDGRDFAIYMRAAAAAQAVWDANREHPGAAHYLIHSFDDPVHAPLGLPMARVYSKIAPAAAHAQHMTSHIFVAMGMWEEVAIANEIARSVQTARQTELGQRRTVCGHYPYWLLYGYLQQGRMSDAAVVLDACQERVEDVPTPGELWHFRAMRARYAIDSGDWTSMNRWVEPGNEAVSGWGAEMVLLAEAYAGWKRGELEPARRARKKLEKFEALGRAADDVELAAIAALEVEALVLIEEEDVDLAISRLRDAVEAEHALPYAFGPPQLAKPASELLGEVLALLARWEESREAFSTQLARTPERAQAMSGFVEAARRLGDRAASDEVAKRLSENFSRSDAASGAGDDED